MLIDEQHLIEYMTATTTHAHQLEFVMDIPHVAQIQGICDAPLKERACWLLRGSGGMLLLQGKPGASLVSLEIRLSLHEGSIVLALQEPPQASVQYTVESVSLERGTLKLFGSHFTAQLNLLGSHVDPLSGAHPRFC